MVKKYQKRPDDVTARAWSRGYLTPLDLFKVAAWKTGQGLGSLTVNTEEEIAARTRAAIDCVRPWRNRPIRAEADDPKWRTGGKLPAAQSGPQLASQGSWAWKAWDTRWRPRSWTS